jgi:hypothetical protein
MTQATAAANSSSSSSAAAAAAAVALANGARHNGESTVLCVCHLLTCSCDDVVAVLMIVALSKCCKVQLHAALSVSIIRAFLKRLLSSYTVKHLMIS